MKMINFLFQRFSISEDFQLRNIGCTRLASTYKVTSIFRQYVTSTFITSNKFISPIIGLSIHSFMFNRSYRKLGPTEMSREPAIFIFPNRQVYMFTYITFTVSLPSLPKFAILKEIKFDIQLESSV